MTRRKWLRLICATGMLLLLAATPSYIFAAGDLPTGTLLWEDTPVRLPILMYHQLSDDYARRSRYVITPDEFEADLQTLQDHGYTTVTVKDLIDYVHRKKALPEKPVMLTFDDGYESDYVHAFPLLKKYNVKAVFSVIGIYADLYSGNVDKDIKYSHLSWTQIKEMHESGLAEFHNHTYDMHNCARRPGALKRNGETLAAYENIIAKDFKLLNTKYYELVGTVPTAFACPFGYYNEQLKQTVRRQGYSAILTSAEQLNFLTGDPEELYRLGRFVRPHTMDLEKQIKEWESHNI